MNYSHGGDVYTNIVEYDFSVNINPMGMPRESIRAAHEGVVLSGRYPDYMGARLCRGLSVHFGIPRDCIILGNGAAELIYAVCNAVKAEKGMVMAPSFSEYESALHAAGSSVSYWMLSEDDDFDLSEAFVDYIDGSFGIVFLCNPNNPTGRLIDRKLLMRIADRCEEKKVYLCVDESFLPFVSDEEKYTMMGSLAEYNRLIVLRSFTKIYGMPGLRLGCALSYNSKLLGSIRAKMQPWNTSVPAQMAGYEALKDKEFVEKTRELIADERRYLVHELSQGLADKIYEGAANYIMFKADAGLYGRLMSQGVMIRNCADFKGLTEEYYRIGVRSHSENKELVRRWREV